MKILALDLGDQWVGVAISDASRILARPLTTVTSKELYSYLNTLFAKEKIAIIIVGYPKTLGGTESAQTKKVVLEKEALEKEFPLQEWILWDERLSSKQAAALGKSDKKLELHAKAAALVLDGYLMHLQFQAQSASENIPDDID